MDFKTWWETVGHDLPDTLSPYEQFQKCWEEAEKQAFRRASEMTPKDLVRVVQIDNDTERWRKEQGNASGS